MPTARRRTRNAYSNRVWRRVRLVILERDGWECRIAAPGCAGQATTVDHVTPLDEGGAPFDTANLRAACAPCNARGGAKITNAKRGLGVPSRRW